ncbi:hypothetical protein BX616_005504, partial [Lobosporangium transversale]
IFDNLSSLNAQLQSMTLPEVGAVIMHGDAKSTEDFGAPFIQLANAKHWNKDVRLNISFIGSDTFLQLESFVAENNHALLATVEQDPGPWNRMWNSVGFQIVIRGLDVITGVIFIYGLWVLAYIIKGKQDQQHSRRFSILLPGCFYLPLSIAFAPYKVTVPWRNAVYYLSLLFPFISLGLQMVMWGKLVYRIDRRKANKIVSYFAYVTIFVPVISSFLDGIGWLIPSAPLIRMIGERGFSYVTPAVILVQAILIFYFAIMFFKSLKGIAVSHTTRTALIKITVLNLAMVSFFVLMLLSRIVSLLGLNMKSRSAYITELVIFRFSFLFFYAACFCTLSMRQPTGSSMDSKDGSGYHNGSGDRNDAKNYIHYPLNNLDSGHHSSGGQRSRQENKEDEPTKPNSHFNKYLSNHASRGFTISDPASPKLTQDYIASPPIIHTDSSTDFPDPYRFNEFAHLTPRIENEDRSSRRGDNYRIDIEGLEDDHDSVYGSHRFHRSPIATSSRTTSDGYSRFDSDERVNK